MRDEDRVNEMAQLARELREADAEFEAQKSNEEAALALMRIERDRLYRQLHG